MSDCVTLDAGKVEELVEFLSLLVELCDFDGSRVAAALEGLTAWSYGLEELRADLDRFITLLGGPAVVFGARPSRAELRIVWSSNTGP